MKSAPARTVLLIAATLGMLTGCQSPDVGQTCSLDIQDTAGDYLETGKTECENLVCIRSAGRADAYCSKPCVSNDDCASGETGLVCRAVVLDPEFMASLPPDVRDKYLGDVRFSDYCATPLP
jgi:hypothetical protein